MISKKSTSLAMAMAMAMLFATQAFSQLTASQEDAKVRGLELYNQMKAISALPFLTVAAKAGDRDSQYYLAEALRKNNRHMTPEAQKWYEAAANQGDFYAMIQLGRSDDDMCKVMENCPDTKKKQIESVK